LIGLQLRPILQSLDPAERIRYLQTALIVLAAVVLVRLAWVMIYNRAAWLKMKWFGPGMWPGADRPTLAGSTVMSWCGMRGIVTLAAAYALPAGFPHRSLILLCAFCVVVGTLVLQGLTLRPLIHMLKLADDGSVDAEVQLAHRRLEQIAQDILDGDNSEMAQVLRDEFVPARDEGSEQSRSEARNKLRAAILAAQRDELVRLRADAEIGDDAFHAIEERLDRSEVSVA
jgi:CPA1 family monovalent cation:H+ antiporter